MQDKYLNQRRPIATKPFRLRYGNGCYGNRVRSVSSFRAFLVETATKICRASYLDWPNTVEWIDCSWNQPGRYIANYRKVDMTARVCRSTFRFTAPYM